MHPSIQTLIDKIRIVADEHALLRLFEEIKPGVPGRAVRIAFVNAHGFNMCCENPDFLADILECDYIFRDGAGMKILYRLFGRDAGLNLNGTDLIPRIMDLYKGHDIALMGTSTPYLESAAAKLADKGLYPVVVMNGFQELDAYLQAVHEVPVPMVVLAMGMPKQEKIAAQLSRSVHVSTLIICGGAILDFMGGKVSRAPEFIRKIGMEWVYRLIQEPRRLFKRYVFGNFKFLVRAVRLRRLQKIEKSDKRKILHVVRQYHPSIGGLESYVQNLVAHQSAQGSQCDVLTLNRMFHGDRKTLPDQDCIHGVKIYRVGFAGFRRFFVPFVSPFFFKKYDIVHVHNTDVFYDYTGICCFLTRVPVFATTHGGFFHTQDFSLIKKIYFQTVTRFTSLFYKKIFAISRNDEATFRKISKKTVYLPNAIEPLGDDIFSGQDFLYIGRLAQNKDIALLIEVFSCLKKNHGVEGHLHIVGPEWDVSIDSLRETAAKHNVFNDVVFHGSCNAEHMYDIAKRCGYFVSASSYEGFGMSMLEGMSVGLIPLVHNNEAFTQLVGESKVGVATDFGYPSQAAGIVASYIPKVSLNDRIKAQKFTKSFSWADLTAKLDDYYYPDIS